MSEEIKEDLIRHKPTKEDFIGKEWRLIRVTQFLDGESPEKLYNVFLKDDYLTQVTGQQLRDFAKLIGYKEKDNGKQDRNNSRGK
jgi:hypothetical protein